MTDTRRPALTPRGSALLHEALALRATLRRLRALAPAQPVADALQRTTRMLATVTARMEEGR